MNVFTAAKLLSIVIIICGGTYNLFQGNDFPFNLCVQDIWCFNTFRGVKGQHMCHICMSYFAVNKYLLTILFIMKKDQRV